MAGTRHVVGGEPVPEQAAVAAGGQHQRAALNSGQLPFLADHRTAHPLAGFDQLQQLAAGQLLHAGFLHFTGEHLAHAVEQQAVPAAVLAVKARDEILLILVGGGFQLHAHGLYALNGRANARHKGTDHGLVRHAAAHLQDALNQILLVGFVFRPDQPEAPGSRVEAGTGEHRAAAGQDHRTAGPRRSKGRHDPGNA